MQYLEAFKYMFSHIDSFCISENLESLLFRK
jgi:hypothetical protein